jgi:hypothetical protein
MVAGRMVKFWQGLSFVHENRLFSLSSMFVLQEKAVNIVQSQVLVHCPEYVVLL